MATERRIARLCSLIKQRVAEVLQRGMKDPRLGFVTITSVELDRELTICKVFWSVLGDEKSRKLSEKALNHGRKFVQHEVAEILPTRTVPQLQFVFDESVEGVLRVHKLLDELNPPAEGDPSSADSEPDPGQTDG